MLEETPRHTSRLLNMAVPMQDTAPRQAVPIDPGILARMEKIDQTALLRYRLQRLRAELRKRDYAGAVLFDPMNLRYATGTRNMAVWTAHAPSRYAFVATDGPVILFEFTSSRHVTDGSPIVDEVRPCTPWIYFLAGARTEEKAHLWADEIDSLLRQYGGSNRRLAVDRCDPLGAMRLQSHGVQLFDVQEAVEQARMVKSAEEIACVQSAIEVCDLAVGRMRQALVPGITENQLWSLLHETNIAHGGEWIECRLLASGPRTNPWFQESGNRVIEAGDIVGFDTDLVGPFGYLADISRSWICPDRKPSDRQKRLYDLATEQVLFNMELLRPGLTFREFAEKSWSVPDEYVPNRYMMMLHGCGFVDEYPSIAYVADWQDWGYDGVFAENMVVSVESYLGEVGGPDGIKLEQQVVIGAEGARVLSKTPLIDALAT
ncbi:peptidase M24 [Aliidongia dinghuensis]|uniref:Peptidase M24 n=1 Tax=Aliidongia dinghuensis TaxID=1867774 RepID=A0A8J2Z0C2_9PROT|nr:Xaa-Pro peptidase family protein [Aliidongia dinghuensis]GGF43844.1 peptidase M24 [Aliidongia dinghuensis]